MGGYRTSGAVEEAIIRPLLDAFPPPTHVRGSHAAMETLLNVYRRALERFERPVLEQAWQKVAQEQDFWVWPLPETLVKAAEHFHNLAHPFDPKQADALVEKVTALTDAYVKRFLKTSQTAVRAREGGYEAKLSEYVTAAAWVQAQLIAGRKGVGYSAYVLFGRPPDSQEVAEFFQKAKVQADSGTIRVHVPVNKVAGWKAEACGEKGR